MINSNHFSDRILFLFQKYLDNACNEEEINELLDAISNPVNQEQVDLITYSLWEAVKKQNNKKEYDYKYDILQKESQELIYMAENRKKRLSDRKQKIFRLTAAAAVVVLLLVSSISYWIKKDNSTDILTPLYASEKIYFQTTMSEVRTITLEDGSVITLNGGTNLSINELQYNKEFREVWLDEGEVFFEVAQNPEKPFIVHHGGLNTVVKGTSFNIKAYKQLEFNTVTVATGKVVVNNDSENIGILTPNKELNFDLVRRKTQITETNSQHASGWRNGYYVLNNAGKDELKLRLEQCFGVKVNYQNEVFNNLKFNSILEKGTHLEDVLDRLCGIYHIKYRINDNEIYIYK